MRNSSKISVCLADDHTIFRKALITLLKTFERIGVIRDAANGNELIALVKNETPDVVLVDLHMPVMDGEEVCERLERDFPEVKVIVLTMEDDEEYVKRLINLGVHGYLSKEETPEEVEKAIYAVFDKDFYHNDLVNRALRGHPSKLQPSLHAVSFSPRDMEIIQLICNELTMREIADRLGLSERTVQNHRSTLMDKMKVKNTAGLVKYAVMKRLVKDAS